MNIEKLLKYLIAFLFASILCFQGASRLNAQVSVSFSHKAGCYDQAFRLSIQIDNREHDKPLDIRYTLNGDTPDGYSTLYKNPILLNECALSTSKIYKIPNAPKEFWFCPKDVERIVVVRAAAFDKKGNRCSEVVTRSFIMNSLLGRSISLPIVSICVDSVGLFDFQNGIFIPGASFDPTDSKNTGNYYFSGRESEIMSHFEYVDGANHVSQTCGLRTHGHIGRRYAQKGLSLYARKEYGEKNFKDVLPHVKAKRLVLRPFRNAWTQAGIQNLLCQRLASNHLAFDALRCQPVVLFINGEYWGLYFLEEKPDEHFVARHHEVNRDSVRLVRDWAGHAKNGIDSGFAAMMQWIAQADFTDDKQYAQVSKMIDIPSFIDYVIFETYIGNRDWPSNNMRCWSSEGSAWHFIFFDADAVRTTRFNAVENALCADEKKTWPASPESTLLLRKLMRNKQFRSVFKERLGYLMQHQLRWGGVNGAREAFEQTVNSVGPEVAAQASRFGFPKDVKTWKKAVRKQKRYWRWRAWKTKRQWMRELRR